MTDRWNTNKPQYKTTKLMKYIPPGKNQTDLLIYKSKLEFEN